MSDAAQLWNDILPEVKRGVIGVGVWASLNSCKAVALEEGVLVLGLPYEMGELGGHLKVPSTKRLIETTASAKLGHPTSLRVIEGVAAEDWEAVKRKDAEGRRMQDQAMAKMRAELSAKASWEGVFEQLSRRFAAVPTKSLPQNRARFFEEALDLIVETRRAQETWDDVGERNFARCLERVAQYVDMPSAAVAIEVLRRAGEL